LNRLSLVCPACGDSTSPLDDRLGIDGFLAPQAKRLVCLAGVSWSFDKASDMLNDFCGLRVSDWVVRNACHSCAADVSAWRAESPEATAAFADAPGEWEFQTDGTFVNTFSGWREVKIGIFAKRQPGDPATPAEWDDRELNRPSARWTFAEVAGCDSFAAQWRPTAARLGLTDPAELTVIADGAAWIWCAATEQFPSSRGLIDIYHACEYLSAVGRATFGDGTPEAAAWLEVARAKLLGDGWHGWCGVAGELLAERDTPTARAACEATTEYFAGHTEHLGYFKRLARGQTIGSGMVEGACKQVIGRRLKQTGARWRVDRLNRMAELCCTCYSDCWDAYWATTAA
jgi:hypothetical protein